MEKVDGMSRQNTLKRMKTEICIGMRDRTWGEGRRGDGYYFMAIHLSSSHGHPPIWFGACFQSTTFNVF